MYAHIHIVTSGLAICSLKVGGLSRFQAYYVTWSVLLEWPCRYKNDCINKVKPIASIVAVKIKPLGRI